MWNDYVVETGKKSNHEEQRSGDRHGASIRFLRRVNRDACIANGADGRSHGDSFKLAMESKHQCRSERHKSSIGKLKTAELIAKTAVFDWIVAVRPMRPSRKAPQAWLLAAKGRVVTCPVV